MGGSNDGHTLTSGTFGTVPRRGGVSSPRGPYGSAAGFLPSNSGVAGLSSISPVAILPTMTADRSHRRDASRLWGLGASIDPLKFNIDKSGLRVFLAEG